MLKATSALVEKQFQNDLRHSEVISLTLTITDINKDLLIQRQAKNGDKNKRFGVVVTTLSSCVV